MALTDHFYDNDDHPIDVVEQLALSHDWPADRMDEDHVVITVEGQWRNYTVTMAWSEPDRMLRLILTFEMEPPAHRETALYEALNHANDRCWSGNFTWWADQRLMTYRYALNLAGYQDVTFEQVDTMMGAAVAACERFYPAFQLVTWAERTPSDAMGVAISEVAGTA